MSTTTPNPLLDRVKTALEEIRPFLEEDGGGLEVIEVTDDLIARVEFKGACRDCSMNNMTFKAGVEDAIRRKVPEIKEVEAVNFSLNT
ncbi:MAG: NifU family protein [Salibacteraceae bacterium]